ncbi:two-component system response regulator RppA [Prochlorothrix hollandica]|uniref:Chemotaxis protein CheY n=1 Tax=Prochlorothrix hollandica PCC 9006 = CALU 1027 TaxID=317619 RepID=A0A0M2PUY6_PROHO|nr:two-component system response regulator RppA [Prochlorothrix hollandica]KKI98902.1 chemotaxis protein CheY [Prochlorothrix hollandica PCC 9006 = CALU 1027]
MADDYLILLVDDEPELTAPLSRVLQREGYGVDVAQDGEEGYQLAQVHPYQLLILDWMLPGCSGVEVCRRLRAKGQVTPVLFLTAKDTLDDRVLGLDAGADDYLVKPFELRELLARVRALLRRSASDIPLSTPAAPVTLACDRLTVEDLILEGENQVAYRGDRIIALSEKESQLLAYLMEHAGQLLTHRQILDDLWGKAHQPHSNVLAAQIRLLRRKIEAPHEGTLIHTVYGKGYRFGS